MGAWTLGLGAVSLKMKRKIILKKWNLNIITCEAKKDE